MKRIINPQSHTDVKDFVLLFLRIAAGILLITHGFPKLQKLLSDEPVKFISFMGMSPAVSLTLAMLAEFICAILVMAGFLTRIAAIPIVITMCVVIFHVHGADPLSAKELPVLYLICYTAILFMGAGKHSLDTLLHRKFFKDLASAT